MAGGRRSRCRRCGCCARSGDGCGRDAQAAAMDS
jgi:hypothetical protein